MPPLRMLALAILEATMSLPFTPLEHYCQLIHKYHHSLDLMSAKGLAQFEQKCAQAAAYTRFWEKLEHPPTSTQHILDIGSGVGLPAIPMALLLPDVHFHLVERRSKRSSFLKIVVSQLGLANVHVYAQDVQKLELAQPVDAVTALAVGNFGYVYDMCQHLFAEDVWLISRKGHNWREDVATLTVKYRDVRTEALADGEAVLVAVHLHNSA